MKRNHTRSTDVRKRRRGWHAESYHEPDSDDNLEEEAHHHTRATFSTSGSHASTSTLFTPASQLHVPLPPKATFTDANPDIEENGGYFLSGDSLDWARYGIMDPEESAAWDEEHGLKDKRARTASVWFLYILIPSISHWALFQDNPMAQWVSHSRSLTLDEMIRLEGRGSYARSVCAECSNSQPTLHCDDCFGGELFCEECVIKLHVRNPLHNITVWTSFISFRLPGLNGGYSAGMVPTLNAPLLSPLGFASNLATAPESIASARSPPQETTSS